ncbi:MAG: hypothetical protein IID37_04135 [Planctomycetes bacterium]|nr:hypothetical protein [Planctomycetota bacterium]
MARVYLETSFISACVTNRTDAASVYRRETSIEWWSIQRPRHTLLVSDEVVAELSDPSYPQRSVALEFITGIESLRVTHEVIGLARILVDQKVMPGPLKGDAVHVAAAAFHGMDYMLSWNVRHLANPNKTQHLGNICMRLGLVPPRIVTPDLLWEVDDEPS